MQEIARFLATHPPFDGLPPEALEQTAATVEIAYFPRGTSILRQSGEPSRYLHVIVKGVVELRQADDRGTSELVETLARGETFGQLSLLSRSAHLWDVVAREDVLAYLIPSDQVERLRHQPEEEALLHAAIFFDFRQLHGDLDAEPALRTVIRRAAGNRRFLGRLAKAALRRRPPLGFLRHLRGDHQGRIDLKAHGTAAIVDLARLLALEAGSTETATVARLRRAAERGTVGRTAADLAAAFEYLRELRLRHQADRLRAAAAPDDLVRLADLGALERRWLKDAFHLLHTCQESVRLAFQTDLIA